MIGEGFTVQPKLAEPFPSGRKTWTCNKTGLIIPMEIEKNLEYREKILHKAEHDSAMQVDLLAACAESLLYFVNTFCWTKWEWEFDPILNKVVLAKQAHHPFVTFERQDEFFTWLEKRFEYGKDGLVDKSRRMGASWACVIYLHWLWLFRPNTEIREMSRSEVYVDSPISKSLFFKHDYINHWLPEWMRPPGVMVRGHNNRTSMRIYNELNGSTIAGESTTKHALSADRCAILLLDEFSKVDNGDEIRTATADVAPCRIVNSTVSGSGTAFSEWKHSGLIDVFSLMFWDHPTMGAGRFVLQDPVTKTFQISSTYAEHEKKRRSEKELAQELYAIDALAGDTFFSLKELNTHIALHARPPKASYNINLKRGVANDQLPQIIQRRDIGFYTISKPGKGKLDVWGELIEGRPDQNKTYIFGIDTSKGQGASESVVSIKCKQTGEIIAKWRCRFTPPYEFARIIVALSLWCGGCAPQRLPYLKWENNGPGWDLGKLLVKDFRYPHYYRAKSVGTVIEKEGKKYGFQTSRESKELLLRAYEQALLQGRIINHDERGLEQAKKYIYYPNGGVGPATLQDKKLAERLLHGDIVIADALTTEDRDVAEPKGKKRETEYGQWGYRFEQWKKKNTKSKGWREKYNFA